VKIRTLAMGAALAATAIAAAACDSPKTNRTGDGGGRSGGDLEDTLPVDVVRVVSKEHAPDGRVTYVFENISGKLQEDLTYHVEFHYPASVEGAIKSDEIEVSQEKDLVLLKSDLAKSISIENPKPGHAVVATRLAVQSSPPIAAVARDANGPGTYFLNRAIECVGMATPEEIGAGSLWIEIENVSDRAVTELEAKAVFVDQMTKEKGAETKWADVRDLPKKGARSRVDFNLGGLGKVANLSFLVKLRQKSL